MKINKLFFGIISMLTLLVFSACSSDDDYNWATVSGSQVYFSNALPTKNEVSKSVSSFTVPVRRVKTSDAITVPITVAQPSGSIYKIPTSVSFAAGDSVANLVITYNPADIVYGNYEDITLKIGGDSYSTLYGLSSYTFKAGATAWVLDETAKSDKGSYREDLVTAFFNAGNPVYDVTIEKNIVEPGKYRLVEPYGAAYPNNEDGDYDASTTHYMVIDASDPDYVYVETSATGMNWKDGNFSFTSLVAYNLAKGTALADIKANHPEWFGKLKDGVITMPKDCMLTSMADYKSGAWYKSNNNGLFAVALPGYTISDYSLTGDYAGRFTDANDLDYADVKLTFGADVTSVKYVLIPATGDVDATVKGIENDGIKAGTATESSTVRVPFTDSGDYYLVVVIYNGDNAVGTQVIPLTLKSSHDTEEKYKDIAAGTLTLGAKNVSTAISSDGSAWKTFPEQLGLTAPYAEEATLSQSESDPTHFKISPFLKDKFDFYFTCDAATGAITVTNVDTGFPATAGEIMIDDLNTLMGQDLTSYGLGNSFANNIYTFTVAYHVGTSCYSAEKETFEITTTAAKSIQNAIKRAKAKASTKTFIGKTAYSSKMHGRIVEMGKVVR